MMPNPGLRDAIGTAHLPAPADARIVSLALVNFFTVGDDSARRYPELPDRVDLVLLSSEPYPFKARHAAEIRTHAGERCPRIELFDGAMASWYGARAIRAMDYLARFAVAITLGRSHGIHPGCEGEYATE